MKPRRFLGVDVGGTSIKLAAVEIGEKARIAAEDAQPVDPDRPPGEQLDAVAGRLGSLVDAAGWKEAEGVGIGSAGLIRPDPGTILFSPNLPDWAGVRVADPLSRALSLPARMDNDVNAFAMAEWRWGAGGRLDDVVFLTVGTGIGGAVIAGGRLLRGAHGLAGEPGHATLVLDGIPCPCGNRGCAERYVGKQGIVDAARRHPAFRGDPLLSGLDPLTPEALSEAARRGSRVAGEVYREAGRALGGLLVTLVNVFDPARIVLGGGIAQAGDLLLEPARTHLEERSLVARHAAPEVLEAELGETAGVLGAAALMLDDEGSLEAPGPR